MIIKTEKNILQGYHEVFDNVLYIHTCYYALVICA